MSKPGSQRVAKPRKAQGWTPSLRRLAAVGVACLLGLAFWWREHPAQPEPMNEALAEGTVVAMPHTVATQESEAPPPLPRKPEARPVLTNTKFQDEAADPHSRHPHPITKQHLKNYRQVDLLRGAWVALKQGDFTTGRQLINAHRAEYPGEWEDMNEGLSLAADCMQHPTRDSVTKARRFYDERTASTMRKRIRRYCLEPHEAELSSAPR